MLVVSLLTWCVAIPPAETVPSLLRLPTTLAATATATPPARPDQVRAVKRSIAATVWPLEPAVGAGFVWSSNGIVPFAGATVFVPIIPGVGPVVVARGAGTFVGDVSFAEAMGGIGVAYEGRMGDVRARASLVPTVVLTSLADGSDSVVSVTPGAMLPLELGLPLGAGVSFTGTVEPGVAVPVAIVEGGQIVSGRDRLFVMVGAGITFGGPVD
jgi:hypothetical protein